LDRPGILGLAADLQDKKMAVPASAWRNTKLSLKCCIEYQCCCDESYIQRTLTSAACHSRVCVGQDEQYAEASER